MDTIVVCINGVPRDIDRCIVPLVKALNDAGINTLASCCGHGVRPGNIVLNDKRELIICSNYNIAREVEKAFPSLNQGLKE